MAALMMMASPMTAKAEEVVGWSAYEIGEYRIPSIKWDLDAGEYGEYVSSDLIVQLKHPDNPDEGWDSWRECPAGYEVRRSAVISLSRGTSWWWEIEGDNTKNWEMIGGDGDEDYAVSEYSFSVDYNNTVYPDCRLVMRSEYGEEVTGVTIKLIVPQGYNDDIWYTIYGGKVQNGEDAMDESSQLRFFLCGNASGAGQSAPATTSQPAPETVEQQPVAEITSQPVPETISQPTPATSYQGTVYVTKPGDNLAKIAKEVYGDRNLWKDIYEQNKELIKNPNVIYAIMQLVLP